MEQKLEATLALLERTPGALDELLRGLPEEWTQRNEGEGTWSVYEVMKHLVKAEGQNWVPRARMILEAGEQRPFPPFVRVEEQPEKKSLEVLLHEFGAARRENLDTIRGLGLTDRDLAKRGVHPNFGAVTLGQLLSTWAAHDLTHLHQISRVMALQYKEAVGPWAAFLGVMRCNGHSD